MLMAATARIAADHFVVFARWRQFAANQMRGF